MDDRYKKVSNKNGGQYAGPCYFTGEGSNRFVVEPATGQWFCRAGKCAENCGYGKRMGEYRIGTLPGSTPVHIVPEKRKVPRMLDMARRLAANLQPDGVAYLASRGISLQTAQYFVLGQLDQRITIPLLYTAKGTQHCIGIKKRWIETYRPRYASAYEMVQGSRAVGIFNHDVLATAEKTVIIANSLFDVMLLHQLGFVVVGPFAGEASWEERWCVHFKARRIVNIADRDEEGQGMRYALSRAIKLKDAPNLVSISTVLPEEGCSDISDMYALGMDVQSYIRRYYE